MKKLFCFMILFGLLTTFCSCETSSTVPDDSENSFQKDVLEEDTTEKMEKTIIVSEEDIFMLRFRTPEGYQRMSVEEGSFAEFLRNYPLKKAESPVLLYDGREKGNQRAHAAVLQLPIENEDLQQCADSVMRIYAEYLWDTKQYDKIMFHLSDGFEASYVRWREGYRIGFENDKPYWYKKAGYDDSYETFVKYMRIVFAYAGTASMEAFETMETTMAELKTGDVFIKGGSPGHVVMVMDICENADGKKAFLLAQGYMPAQEFHVLKNPLHSDDPWYYEEELTYPLRTPEYTFGEGSLRKLTYLE